jgi:chromosomal replication initiator protein
MFKSENFRDPGSEESFMMQETAGNEQQRSWARVKARLRAELGENVFTSWFGRLDLVSVQDGVAHFSVPTRFLKSWIQSHYCERIQTLFAEEEPDLRAISISVRLAGAKPAPLRITRPAESSVGIASGVSVPALPCAVSSVASPVAQRFDATPAAGREAREVREADVVIAGSPLDRRLTFATFVVGKSNQLSHSACLQVANGRREEMPLYNPLYIHSCVGLGKTHLVQATAHAVESNGRRVLYLTAERFMYGFVSALKAQTAVAFKETLRAIDVLIIDDVQFLQGKSMQQEFCHTLNALIDAGRQVIVAADRLPGDLESLEERVRSRLGGGLVVEMGPLDEAVRVQILEARIAAARSHLPGFDISPEIVRHLARQLTANGRDLDGAVNRLLANATLSGVPLDLETAEAAIRDLIRTRDPKRVKIEDIQRLVASHYSVSRQDILSSRRTATVVRPRQVAMFLSKALTLRSLPEIGRRFGGRDHTTVMHAVRKIDDLLSNDASLAAEVDHLKRMLQE